MAGSLNFERARFNMVEQQVRPWDVIDTRVLDVLGEVKREDFVPPRHRKLAFADLALPLEHGESMMKPVVEGRLLQALAVQADDEVLEIGTGSGFVTACLARLGRMVTSVEIHADLADRARARLGTAGIRNAEVLHADGLKGFRPDRGYDVIAVTGAVASVPQAFKDWLRPGGRLFVVRGQSPVMEAIVYTRKSESWFEEQSLFETDLKYLAGAEPPPRFQL